MPWWVICGSVGAIGAALLLGIEATQGQHTGRIETWFEIVTRTDRPVLFNYVVMMRWLAATLVFIGALALISIPYLFSR